MINDDEDVGASAGGENEIDNSNCNNNNNSNNNNNDRGRSNSGKGNKTSSDSGTRRSARYLSRNAKDESASGSTSESAKASTKIAEEPKRDPSSENENEMDDGCDSNLDLAKALSLVQEAEKNVGDRMEDGCDSNLDLAMALSLVDEAEKDQSTKSTVNQSGGGHNSILDTAFIEESGEERALNVDLMDDGRDSIPPDSASLLEKRRHVDQNISKVDDGSEGDKAGEEFAVMTFSVDMAELDQRRGVDAPMEGDAGEAPNQVRRPPLRSASVGRKTVAATYVGDEKEEAGGKKEEKEPEVVVVDGRPFHLVLQKADGNCLFRSIGHSLKMAGISAPRQHSRMRDTIVDHALDNWQRFGDLAKKQHGLNNKPDYEDKLRENGEWGDQSEILIAADLFHVPIRIYNYGSRAVYEQNPDCSNAAPIYICFNEKRQHYDALIPITGDASVAGDVSAPGDDPVAGDVSAPGDDPVADDDSVADDVTDAVNNGGDMDTS